MTDSTTLTHEADAALTARLLDQILAKAHPLLAEGLYLAAVSRRYNTALFKAMRARDDGRDERLVDRLAQFSFVKRLDGEAEPQYALKTNERQILLQRWIAADPEAFVTAHRRALAFWEAHPHPDSFVQAQTRLYHLLIADGQASLEYLAATFRAYTGERRLAAADRLLVTAAEVQSYLAAMGVPWLADLDDLLAYLAARLAQFRGQWNASLTSLKALRQKTGLSSQLAPYVTRAYGLAQARTGLYVEAIEQYRLALEAFEQQPGSEAERAFTMLGLGDAHVNLAVSARGYRDIVPPETGHWRRWLDGLLSLRALLPLIVYLGLNFGLSVLRPSFWPVLQEQDWIIARLFVTGARWYRQAKRLLGAPGAHADRVQADEKLAYLYLTMGDAAQAAPLFQSLLEEREAPLGEYRRACLQAGLGHALLRLDRPQLALEQIERALPVIRAYEDVELLARAQGLLAEALLETGRHQESLHQFDQAMRLYHRQSDVAGATEIAERLRELGQDPRLDAEERATASTTTQNLTRRQYMVRFQHPALVFFRRVALVLLALFIFLVPMSAIRVDTGSVVRADIRFKPSPLLAPDPNYSPSLSQGVALNVQPSFETGVAVQLAVGLLVFYLLAYTLLGVVLIARTRLRTVQAAQSGAVRLNLQSLTVGEGETASTLHWSDIRCLLTADVAFLSNPIADNSALELTTSDGSVNITGSTAWYVALQNQIRAFLPQDARVKDLSYRLLRSRMGLLYVLGLLALVLFALLSKWAPNVLTSDLPGTPYSLVALYPYLYLGVFLPPFWWIVIRPLQIQNCLNSTGRLVWWIGGAGLLLAVLRGLTFSQSWLIAPDIYPSLAIFVLLSSAGVALWAARRPKTQGQQRAPHIYPLWLRGLVTLGIVAILTVTGCQLWREMAAYHYLIQGNDQRDQGVHAQTEGQDAVAAWLLKKAVASYDRVLRLSPENETALNSRATVLAQLTEYEAAIAGYAQTLEYAGRVDQIYANRALAYVDWGLALLTTDQADAAAEKFDAALSDLDRAIDWQPENADYYVQRGVVHHARGELAAAMEDYQQALRQNSRNAPALAGRGWIHYQRADQISETARQKEDKGDETGQARLEALARRVYRRALASFRQAALYDPASPENWVAVGYGYFGLEEYPATMTAWEHAIELAPDDPLTIISHGMGNWLVADAGHCSSSDATPEEKEEAVVYLNLAIDDLNRALTLQPDDAWTFRTRAQIEYLLAFCPGQSYEAQIKKAITSYDEAIQYAPDNDFYRQFQARLRFVLGRHIFAQGREREAEAWTILAFAVADINRAYELDPGDETTRIWRDYLTQEAWGRYHQTRGWNNYVAGNYTAAEADSIRAALLVPQDAELAFNVGLTSLAQGKGKQAIAWYDEGLTRASTITETQDYQQTLQIGKDDLLGLLEADPRLRWLGDPILGLLYLRLGEAGFAAKDYAGAAEMFEQAARLQPQDAAVAFKTGLAALAQRQTFLASGWYRQGLQRLAGMADAQAARPILQTAIDDLGALWQANPLLRRLGEPILKMLQTALDAMPPE